MSVTKTLRTTRTLFFSVLLLPLFAGTQQQQKLTPKDYELWDKASKIGSAQVSDDGQWIYYYTRNSRGDSAYIRNVNNNVSYGLKASTSENSYEGALENKAWNFSSDSKWFAISDQDTIRILQLKTGKSRAFKGNLFYFATNSHWIVVVEKKSSSSLVSIHDLISGETRAFPGVNSYKINDQLSALAISSDTAGSATVSVIELSVKFTTSSLVRSTEVLFDDFKWNKLGNSVAFVGRPKAAKFNTAENTVYVCDAAGAQASIKKFVPSASIRFDDQKKGRLSSLYLSDDGRQLFFEVRETRFPEPPVPARDSSYKPVEIWGASALSIPVIEEKYNHSYWYVWHSAGYVETITSKKYPNFFVSGDLQNIMVYNKLDYLPRYKYVHSFADIYLKSRTNDSVILLAPKIKDHPDEFMTSAAGKYIAYFKKNHWWVYDFQKGTHSCITRDMDIDWSTDEDGSTGVLPPFGSPGWLKDDKSLIVFDKYDIWLISPDGKDRRRITNGREENITYRIVEEKLPPRLPGRGNQWFSSRSYDADEGLFITSVDYDNIENGWWWWTTSNGLIKIISKEKKIDLVHKPFRGRPLLYKEQNFDLSPRLVLRHVSGKEEVIYQTNPQQQNYYWGKSTVIRYSTIDGKDLSGALLFPANYDSSRKYPMVVEIYQTRSKDARLYIEPSESTDKSNYCLNPTVYTQDDYFVLFPDISYRVNEPGISAVRCVAAAVQAACDNYNIDIKKIGLTGHSFGGYETCFIISQTDMFATAIAGAAITDLPDFYLGISSFGTNFTRVEEDQFRMQVPFYSEQFVRNSPMHNIDKIRTPILLYTGQEDANVHWTQSRRFQTALWRLGKQSSMLVYPGEDHVILKPENQDDLAKRMKDWFDYYLKDTPPAEWIKENMGIK